MNRKPTYPASTSIDAQSPIHAAADLARYRAAVQADDAAADIAGETRRAYEHDWAEFQRFCHRQGLCPLPADPAAVLAFVGYLAVTPNRYGRIRSPGGVNRAIAAVAYFHRDLRPAADGEPVVNPARHELVKRALRNRQRAASLDTLAADGSLVQTGYAVERKRPLLISELRQVVGAVNVALTELAGQQGCRVMSKRLGLIRDRALLLLGHAGGFRRSELVNLRVEDVRWQSDGVQLHIRRSKTDQTGQGRYKAICRKWEDASRTQPTLTCPVAALRQWIDAADIRTGFVFLNTRDLRACRHDKPLDSGTVALKLKALLRMAGLTAEGYSGHSLRRGFVTEARTAGVQDGRIIKQTGHSSAVMLDKTYDAGWVNIQDSPTATMPY